ncbi:MULTISPECIES: hypothetical protein [unclassified Chelatococcus]|uniref:hypothetical protein n=1 Tax=unclassified Chelatococcus TaxID=2638111 RepID=UPI001BD03C44|nr:MULTISPECIES: hypothetical protein [unclassified Chelatococcus]CAH1665500.1 hypothetical protein CHELA41_22674 [Hyphomicrobiales bacterium]MBS7737728.1 hypothetical protein [Chelatococcus sp. HY11]MBX3544138.1 hypothetical protein [Chelatococcus sp.]MCO5077144.1 hypothetical protein [Chelatococcus sp.]CAH1681297.1 hypothetical protein CHELA20_52245 [Hyphomicrobiales bacterium]
MITEKYVKEVLAAIEALKTARAHRKSISGKMNRVSVAAFMQRPGGYSDEQINISSYVTSDLGNRVAALIRQDADQRVAACERRLRQLGAEIPMEASHGSA